MAANGDQVDAQDAEEAVLPIARVGIIAYGVVHLVIGWIALQLAFGDSSGEASATGALQQLAQQPMGSVLLWVVVVGMAAMSVWQVISAIRGTDTHDDRERFIHRAKSIGRAIVYLVLGSAAFRVVTRSPGATSGSGKESMTAALLAAPMGRVLVLAVALGILVVGGYHVHKGATSDFRNKVVAPPRSTILLGRAGYLAKGVVLGIVAVLFGWAALTANADRAGGMDQALQTLREQPFGVWLLAVVGVGLMAYGVFCFAWARRPRRQAPRG